MISVMNNLRKLGVFAASLVAAFAVSAPASAQLEVWKDYEPSDGVWVLTVVDLDPGTMDIYLEGLKSTWVAGNEVAKELGHIKDYGIYVNQFGEADFDLLLVVEMESTDDIAPSRERYEEFLDAWGEANLDKANEKVLELYNKIRKIQGNYLMRRIEMK